MTHEYLIFIEGIAGGIGLTLIVASIHNVFSKRKGVGKMKIILLALALSLLSWNCSTTPLTVYNRIKYQDTCASKIVNLKYYTMKPPTAFPLEKNLYQYWRIDKMDDTTAIIRLVYDTLYYSKDLKEWFKIEGGIK